MSRWFRNLSSLIKESHAIEDDENYRGAGKLSSKEAIEYYRDSYWKARKDCLSQKFSILAKSLGRERFDQLANRYIESYPSCSYSIDHYGDQFDLFMKDCLVEEKWIELARLEKTMEEMIFVLPYVESHDSEINVESELRSQNYLLMTSQIDLMSLWNQSKESSRQKRFFLIWYQDSSQLVEEIPLWQYKILEMLQALETTLENLLVDPSLVDIDPMDFQSFFAKIARRNLLANK